MRPKTLYCRNQVFSCSVLATV